MKSKLFLIFPSTSPCVVALCGSVSSASPRPKGEWQVLLQRHQVGRWNWGAWKKSHCLDENAYAIWQSRSPMVPTMISDTNLRPLWREEKAPLKRCLLTLLLWSQVPSKPPWSEQRPSLSCSSTFSPIRCWSSFYYTTMWKAQSHMIKYLSHDDTPFLILHHSYKYSTHANTQGLWHLLSQISS